MRTASKRVKWTVAILSPIVFFGLVEGLLRLSGFRYEPGLEEAAKPPKELEVDVYVPDEGLLWRLRPSSVLDDFGHGFVMADTNSLGLRGPELPGTRREGELRVLCLGDSVTFGLGVRDDETYPAWLERFLRRSPELGDRPVTVVNGGVPGWSAVQAMALLDRLAWFEPDFVVFWLGMNDVQPARGIPDSRHMEVGGALGESVSFLHRFRVVQLVAKLADAVRGDAEVRTRAGVDEYAAAIAELRARAAAGGATPIFVRYPDQMERSEAQIAAIVARAEEVGAVRIAGPARLIHHTATAPEGTDLTGRLVDGEGGAALILEGAEVAATVEEVKEGLASLRRWQTELERRLSLLPETALDRDDLFGDTPNDAVFTDNVHLTAEGNRLAARAIATRILDHLTE